MTDPDKHFQSPYGTFELCRYPARASEPLRAWSAADSLLLQENHRLPPAQNTLVVNDHHGALCVALQPTTLWTDSALNAAAVALNESRNNKRATPLVWSTDTPPRAQRVVMRVPKQLPYFEYQLRYLARTLAPGTTVLAAGMDKHLSPNTADILERCIGPTERHRGERKARLFSATVGEQQPASLAPRLASYACPVLRGALHSMANVFSRDKLDLGSRFLLEQLSQLTPANTVIDLACGNGVLGLATLETKLARRLIFCDESAMAVASAQINANNLFPEKLTDIYFHHGDGLVSCPHGEADLILCNPPFHLDHTVDEFAGRHLLNDCARHLTQNGRLCLVANRHLNYISTLRQTFARVDKIAGNAKFNILLAHKT